MPLYVEKHHENSFQLAQSLAILDYLDEAYPQAPLLPNTPQRKARIRAAAQVIACEIHPLDNLRVLKYSRAKKFSVQSASSKTVQRVRQDGATP